MMKASARNVAISGMALSIALIAQTAQAQDTAQAEQTVEADAPAEAESGFGEILVTARKVGESSQSLPISVAAFTGEELEQKVVLSAQDLQAITPGLTVSNNATGGVPVFAIRGTSTELGIDGGVALYFNDVPLISTVGIMNSFYDVSAIEVLKGPQGTQFGTNTTGGTISVRTNLPTDEFEGYGKVGYGNFDRREIEGMINIPVNEAIGFRFAGNYVKRDGYVKNPDNAGILPEDFQDENHFSLRGTMSIKSGILDNVLIADYYNRDEAPYTAVPVKYVTSGLGIFPPDLGAKVGTYNRVYMAPNLTGVQPDLFGRADLFGVQNRTNLELSDTVSLRNVLGYRNDHTTNSENPPGFTRPVTTDVYRDDKVSQWTDDVTLLFASTDLGLRVSVGGYYSFMRRKTGINANVLQGLFAAFGAPNNVISTNNFERKETESRALYTNGEYDITDTLIVSAGYRYNWDEVRSNVTAGSNVFNPATPLGTLPIFGADFFPTAERPCDLSSLLGYANFNPATCEASRSATFKAPSWMFGLSNKFSNRVLGYAKISHGYLAGGTNFTLRDEGRTTYQPEKNTMIEVGVKADWDLGGRPIRVNAALYRGKISGKQVFANANYDGGGTGFGVVNAAKETIYGLDLETRYSPVAGLTLDLNYNYIKAKFDEFIYPGLGGPSNATYIPPVDLSGATPAQTPKHQINGAITYVWPTDDDTGEVSTTLSGYYTSRTTQANRLGEFDKLAGGAEFNELPGYFLANGSINWKNVMGSPATLQIWGRNLLNKRYGTSSQVQFATFGYATITYGPPRTYGASLRFDF
ncbi:Outer membrane receptor proteins, mostly Fe transport [Sphingopyxis flava]|uniref:Outer membrane receptor proteins, mostly Fe transport n=2 Tax=Sphingopyxis flava TaxID=1507287 RepID=A0A1T5G2I3_9SPHN|nr:Outer membrane receptor proteins, mostly Fe transport [Sphingopyxis flava]